MPKGNYIELEAALYWGYSLHDWQRESVVNKATAIAHFLHKTMRDGYIQEKMMPKKKAPKHGLKSLMGSLGMNYA